MLSHVYFTSSVPKRLDPVSNVIGPLNDLDTLRASDSQDADFGRVG